MGIYLVGCCPSGDLSWRANVSVASSPWVELSCWGVVQCFFPLEPLSCYLRPSVDSTLEETSEPTDSTKPSPELSMHVFVCHLHLFWPNLPMFIPECVWKYYLYLFIFLTCNGNVNTGNKLHYVLDDISWRFMYHQEVPAGTHVFKSIQFYVSKPCLVNPHNFRYVFIPSNYKCALRIFFSTSTTTTNLECVVLSGISDMTSRNCAIWSFMCLE